MVKKKRNVVTADKVDLEQLEQVLRLQGNPIAPALASLIRIVAPILARIAIRYVARKLKRHVSEATVRSAGAMVGGVMERIIERAQNATS